jgi:hypothetical protein
MNQKKIVLSISAIIAIASMIVSTTQITNIAYADRDLKSKTYVSAGGIGGTSCTKKDGGCKDFKELTGGNVNKVVREACEPPADAKKCKQFHGK